MEGFKVHSTPDVESVGFVAPSPVATVLPSTPSGKFARRGRTCRSAVLTRSLSLAHSLRPPEL
jgi:hypothetical protein